MFTLSHLKKYQTIVNDLSNDIKTMKYTINSPLPSETKLMEKYNVSRITVRKALDMLTNMGLIYKVQGKGCFVMGNAQNHSLLNIHSYTEEIINAGMTPSRKILSQELCDCPIRVKKLFGYTEDTQIFILERLIYADNKTLCLTNSYLPIDILPNINDFDFTDNSLYQILKSQYGINITRTQLSIHSYLVDERVAAKMLLPENHTVLQLYITAYGIYNNKEIPIDF